MPVPGPRTQYGPLPGYSNPDGEVPGRRFNRWGRPAPVAEMGRTPGLMFVSLRGNILGAGQIRRFWRQAVNYIAAPAPYSWSSSSPNPGQPSLSDTPFAVTRSLRYMTRSISVRSGEDNSKFPGLHTRVRPQVRSKPVTLPVGGVRNRPTVRNRMTSFGSRVPTLNKQSPAAEGADQ